jgi:hypothetical protein
MADQRFRKGTSASRRLKFGQERSSFGQRPNAEIPKVYARSVVLQADRARENVIYCEVGCLNFVQPVLTPVTLDHDARVVPFTQGLGCALENRSHAVLRTALLPVIDLSAGFPIIISNLILNAGRAAMVFGEQLIEHAGIGFR